MTESVWSKKTIAAIAVAAFLGTLAPISASAIDQDDTVTVRLDLGDGDGGGGPTDPPCISESSITLGVNLIELSSASNGFFFPKEPVSDFMGPNAYLNNDRTMYSAENFQVAFDADSCIDSVKTGTLSVERGPVLREGINPNFPDLGKTWVPAEMTWSKGVLASDELRATANLIFSDGSLTASAFNVIHWETPPADEFEISAWQVAQDSLDSQNMASYFTGNEGVFYPEAQLLIFGDERAGKWSVSFGFILEVLTLS